MAKVEKRTPIMFDTHCHLGFGENDADTAHALPDARFVCMTCDPRELAAWRARFTHAPNVSVAPGLHPRWIAKGACGEDECELLCQLAERERIIGEVGLDFLGCYADSAMQQSVAFERITGTCAALGDKVISIHALRSASAVLDALCHHRAHERCACIMHWFSGSSEELHRAIRMGCWFSVNDRMLASGKGREYAKVIPASRLLLESDLPAQPGDGAGPEQMRESLERALGLLETIRRQPCAQTCLDNALALFGR